LTDQGTDGREARLASDGSWPSLATAVALLARRRVAPEVPRSDVLDGQAAGAVLEAMELLCDSLLCAAAPDDLGARMLEHIGALAALGYLLPSGVPHEGDDAL
jgi:hypothetical protein